MTTLKHAVKIKSTLEKTFKALTEISEMQCWHLGKVSGDISVGHNVYIDVGNDRFGWRTDKLIPNAYLEQSMISGSKDGQGKVLSFHISPLSDGRVLVELIDGQWDEESSHLPFCNTHWGIALHNLKAYLEK
ncbi:SRPBCC domain-containing protein [Serratia ureilytica]|uniref:SRPBCC domain-containing protein n=1 Tax=Serratia ureilytica TaxID=300181 RepID=UPI0039B3DB14